MFKRALTLLEYDKIKKRLETFADSSLGREWIERLTPLGSLAEVEQIINETDEAVDVLRVRGHLPFGGITDIRPELKRAVIGSVLGANELIAIADVVRASRTIKRFINETKEDHDLELAILSGIADGINPPVALEKMITQAIDDDGRVRDDASDKLRAVRTQIRTFESRIKEKLESIVRSPNHQKMLSESLVTIRNDRYVVPVKQEYRHAFSGLVHDQSASGATLFIEPQAIVDINNRLNEAKAQEKREIHRILTALTTETSAFADGLIADIERLGHIDFMFAKAKFARSIKAVKPGLRDDGTVKLKKARHPLIPEDDVVPIDVALGEGTDAIIITGPNTGGKTVTLKTIGLVTVMAQSGLHIPADEGSIVNVFERVFADIGDEQSIEQSLSTFSSHMTNIVSILERVNEKSLVLFDELGAGTDPQEGAALSIAILNEVFGRGASVVATTHYSELKAYAYEKDGVVNASVEFDVETLRPTYKLLMGIPGRSNAFEISRRLGLQDHVVQEAKALIGADTAKIDQMIASLEQSRKSAEAAEQEAKRYREASARLKDELDREKQILNKKKDDIIQAAERKAQEAVDKARREADAIIKELREKRQHHSQIKEHELIDAKKRLDEALGALSNETQGRDVSYKKTKTTHFEPGQAVKATRFGQNGHIIEKISDDEYLVQVGIMKMNLKAEELKPVKAEREVNPVVNVRTANTSVKTELDLRGERFEDAMAKLDHYLDAALLAGYARVSIIHGKGTGALRKGVGERLKRHPRVKSARLGGQGEGDSGVTIVELK